MPASMMVVGETGSGVAVGALSVAVLLVGTGKHGRHWLDLGVFYLQPSELLKISLPMMVACSTEFVFTSPSGSAHNDTGGGITELGDSIIDSKSSPMLTSGSSRSLMREKDRANIYPRDEFMIRTQLHQPGELLGIFRGALPPTPPHLTIHKNTRTPSSSVA